MDNTDPPPTPDTMARLVRRTQAGDSEAFDELARRCRAAVLAVTFSRTGDRDEAEDLAQEVLVRAREKLCDLQCPEALMAWLKTIALNACRGWYRRSRPWPESLDAVPQDVCIPDPGPGPLEVLLAREAQREWRRALAVLPEANRLALLMHTWGDYSYEEIAAFTGAAVGTVAGRIHRAKTQMRRLLKSGAADLLGEPRRRWRKEDR